MHIYKWSAAFAIIGAVIVSIGSSLFVAEPTAQGAANALRYQIVINPAVRADTFLLDTATGRIWSPRRYDVFEGEPRAWELEPRIDNEQQMQAFLAFLATKTLKPK